MQNCTAVDDVLRERLGLEQPAFVAQLLPQLMELVRASRRLPVGEEHAIRRGSKEFLAASKELGQRSMSTAMRSMRWLDPDSTSGPNDIASFTLIEDSIDTVLERVDGCIRDALAGLSRSSEADAEPEQSNGNSQSAWGESSKPQLRWRELIDNHRTEFVPRLLVKHNQKVPLQLAFVEAQCRAGLRAASQQAESATSSASTPGSNAAADAENSVLQSHLSALGVEKDKTVSSLCHPYEEEIRLLSYPDNFFEICKPQLYGRMENTPLVWVQTARELRQMINELKETCVGKEIAVDLEHHDQRSYRGFTCLIQLSTRDKDFIIDPFDIFEQVHWLNEVFTDPSILKVLHGADRDVQWLQRDFSVFIVNMFDTGLATRSLKLQGGFSLANLVSHYCGVKLDKKYQTCDWRQRPIQGEMEHYARCDTHYLLYCFDCLRNALLAQKHCKVGETPVATSEGIEAMRGVLNKSAALCMSQYSEAPFDAANSAMSLCGRFGSKAKPLELKQFSSLKALASWRDNLARQLDESCNFVAPDACLWRVALALPVSAARLRSTCNPLPPLLGQHAAEVVEVIIKTTEGAANAEVPHSPHFSPARKQAGSAGGGKETPTAASAQMLPPAAPATSSAARVEADFQDWPSSSSRKVAPVLSITSGSIRHLTNGSSEKMIRRKASLASMFESESSEEEEIDFEAMRDLEPAFNAMASAHAPPQLPSKVVTEPASQPTASATAPSDPVAEPVKEETPAATSLRDAYQMPGAATRKKKKKKKRPVPADGAAAAKAAAAPAAPAAAAGSLESEAASFRNALAASFSAVPAAAGNLPSRPTSVPAQAKVPVATAPPTPAPPRPTKRKAFEEPAAAVAAADPYGAVTSDPYAATAPVAATASAVPAAATAAAAPAAAAGENGPPRKKKKKKMIRPDQAQAQATPVVDPYL